MLNSAAAGPPTKFRLANPLLRLAAWIVDKFTLLPLFFVFGYALTLRKSIGLALAALVLDFAYKVILEKRRGATVGKLLFKLRVVRREDGQLMTWNQALMRALPWAISTYAWIFLVISYFQTPGFRDVTTEAAFQEFVNQHPLSQSTLLSLCFMAPFLSSSWIVSDTLLRSLHDRLGGTVVTRAGEEH